MLGISKNHGIDFGAPGLDGEYMDPLAPGLMGPTVQIVGASSCTSICRYMYIYIYGHIYIYVYTYTYTNIYIYVSMRMGLVPMSWALPAKANCGICAMGAKA